MSDHCHLNGEGHAWTCVDVMSQQYWCRDCGSLGHKRKDTREMEWERPRVLSSGRQGTDNGFLKGLVKPNRFEREDPTE